MLVNGLVMSYVNGVNNVWMSAVNVFGVFQAGALLCNIFQGESLEDISRILKNIISCYPSRNDELSQDSIEEAEKYVLDALMYNDYFPTQQLAQGSFIRCMENYRALDSETAMTILAAETYRASAYNELFSNIGFNTIGDYLKMCYNNYLIDLNEATRLFKSLASIKSGSSVESELREYKQIRNDLQDASRIPRIQMITSFNTKTEKFEQRFIISSFLAMVVFEFSHMEESSVKIARCQNPECGKFFVANRSSAMYCDYPAPQKLDRTCKEYYPQFLYRKSKTEEESTRLLRNAQNRLRNYKKRHPEFADEINKYILDIQKHGVSKIMDVQSGVLSLSEFEEWLNSLRHEKEIY